MKYQFVFIGILLTVAGSAHATELSATTTASTTATTSAHVLTELPNPVAIRAYVSAAFPDAPIMLTVADCESGLRQYDESGDPLYGGYDRDMIGIFQIYESIHKTDATALNLDLASVEGNVGYARHLYDTQGTTPWNSSRHCWASKRKTITDVSENISDINENGVKSILKENRPPTDTDLGKQIVLLRQIITLLQQLQTLTTLLAQR